MWKAVWSAEKTLQATASGVISGRCSVTAAHANSSANAR
jgi:hypothetical protein